MTAFSHCLLCDKNDLVPLRNYEKFHLVKCRSCSFVFCGKIPTQEELIREYSSAYTRDDAISPITIKRYDEIFKRLEKFRRTNNILDVGAGNGHFLQAAKRYGWEAYGTEFDERAVKICEGKGAVMHHGVLDEKNYTKEMFDVITSFEVMEHINNPKEEIALFYNLLRPEGLVYVTTPNFQSFSKFLLKDKWSVFNYPEHLCYYTPKTLKYLFEKLHFEKLSLQTTGIGISRITASANFPFDKIKNYSTEIVRSKTEGNSWGAYVKKAINLCLNTTRTGDKIKAEFTKKTI